MQIVLNVNCHWISPHSVGHNSVYNIHQLLAFIVVQMIQVYERMTQKGHIDYKKYSMK